MSHNNRHDDMSLKDYCSIFIGWMIVIAVIGYTTTVAIDEQQVYCNELEPELAIAYNTWQADLAELPGYGYGMKLESSTYYHQQLHQFNKQCK